MREMTGDIWTLAKGEYVCITTNGVLKSDGSLVMGKGIAKQAADRFPLLPQQLGRLVREFGNQVYGCGDYGDYGIFSFPTKHHWRNPSDIELIVKSAHQLVRMVESAYLPMDELVYLPRPGCGCGQLNWEFQVKPLLEKVLNDRFVVVSYGA